MSWPRQEFPTTPWYQQSTETIRRRAIYSTWELKSVYRAIIQRHPDFLVNVDVAVFRVDNGRDGRDEGVCKSMHYYSSSLYSSSSSADDDDDASHDCEYGARSDVLSYLDHDLPARLDEQNPTGAPGAVLTRVHTPRVSVNLQDVLLL